MTADLVVLDTDVWSHLFLEHPRRHEHDAEWRRLLVGRTLCIAVQTRAELLAWPEISGWGEQRRALLTSQLDATPTLPVDEAVIRQFAHLTADARRRGDALADKIHTADRWIAATTLAHTAGLLAMDRIYSRTPGLDLLWSAP